MGPFTDPPPAAEPLERLAREIHVRVGEMDRLAADPKAYSGSLRKVYDRICGMCEAHLIVSGAWSSSLDPRGQVSEHARTVLGIDLEQMWG